MQELAMERARCSARLRAFRFCERRALGVCVMARVCKSGAVRHEHKLNSPMISAEEGSSEELLVA